MLGSEPDLQPLSRLLRTPRLSAPVQALCGWRGQLAPLPPRPAEPLQGPGEQSCTVGNTTSCKRRVSCHGAGALARGRGGSHPDAAVCPCESLRVSACPCMFLRVPACPCMLLRVPACSGVSLHAPASPCMFLRVPASPCMFLRAPVCHCSSPDKAVGELAGREPRAR